MVTETFIPEDYYKAKTKQWGHIYWYIYCHFLVPTEVIIFFHYHENNHQEKFFHSSSIACNGFLIDSSFLASETVLILLESLCDWTINPNTGRRHNGHRPMCSWKPGNGAPCAWPQLLQTKLTLLQNKGDRRVTSVLNKWLYHFSGSAGSKYFFPSYRESECFQLVLYSACLLIK